MSYTKLPNYVIKTSFFRVMHNQSPVESHHSFLLLSCKCPLCGDYKRRMFLKEYPSQHLLYCHNCGYSKPYGIFLKHEKPDEIENLKQYFLEAIKDGSAFKSRSTKTTKEPKTKFDEVDYKLRKYLSFRSFPIFEEQVNEKKEKFRQLCIKEMQRRNINELIYTDFYCITSGPLKGYLGIPFFDKNNEHLIHIQGRRMFKPKNEYEESRFPKYLFLKDADEDILLDKKYIWGQWLVDKEKEVIINEGTLNAGFYDNGVATCGARVSDSFISDIRTLYPKRIWAFDNFWTDETGRELTIKLLYSGERCFIVPKQYKAKDGNDLAIEMGVDKIPLDFVLQNTFTGKLGLTKLKLMDERISEIIKFYVNEIERKVAYENK
jgi:hypothetical protein